MQGTYELELPNADGTNGANSRNKWFWQIIIASAGIGTGKAAAMAIVFG